MAPSIPDLAAACQQRLFPAGVFQGTIQYEHEGLNLGQTELALIEKCLRHVEQQDNFLVVNPFSTPLTPAFIILSYMASADPRQPSDLQTTDSTPALLLPYGHAGYLGELENFSYMDEVNASGIYERFTLDTLDEYRGQFGIYSATDHEILTDTDTEQRIGLLFVDLRHRMWQQSIDQIQSFIQAHNIDSVLFYTDTWNAAADSIEQRVAETLEITRGVLTEAETATVGDNPTPVRQQEAILSHPLRLSFPVENTPDLDTALRYLYSLRSDLIANYDDTHTIRLLNGILLDLPVSPRQYDQVAQENAFYDTISEMIETVEDRAAATTGDESELCESFVTQANEVRYYLNETHPKQAAITSLVDDTSEPVILVTRNRMFLQALEQYLFSEFGRLPDSLTLTQINDLDPAPEKRVVFTSTPDPDNRHYAFPPSNDLTVLTYPFFVDTVMDRFKGEQFEGESPPVEVVTRPEPDTETEEEASSESDVVTLSDIEVDISPSITDDDASGRASTTGDDTQLRLMFADGSTQEMQASRRVTVYDEDEEDVDRISVQGVSVGDHILLVEDAATDLYDEVVRIKHNEDEYQKREEFVERWRELLNDVLDRDGMTVGRLHDEMQEAGSELQSEGQIEMWADGEIIGPQDKTDVRITLSIADPRYEKQTDTVFEALKYIRSTHQQVGRLVKNIIIAEFDPTQSADIDSELEEHLRDAIDKADIKRVTDITTVD